jgi:hypothetical protein
VGLNQEKIGRDLLRQSPRNGSREDRVDVAVHAERDKGRSIVLGGTPVDHGIGSPMTSGLERDIGGRGHRKRRSEGYRDIGAPRRIEGSGKVDGSQLLSERDRRRLEIATTLANGRFAGGLELCEMLARFGPGAAGLAFDPCVRAVNLNEET